MRQIVLFGVRSPLTVEYEETCRRAGITIGFAVDVFGSPRLVGNVPLVKLAEVKDVHLASACVICAFGPSRRRELVEIALQTRFKIGEALVDPTSIIASSVTIGPGSYVNAGCVIGAVSMLGSHVVLNRSCSLGHHVMLGDYCSIGPGTTIAGNVRVGEGAVIGAGSTILPNIRIGAGAVVAAGSVVRVHVADEVFVAGNPASERAFDPVRSSLNIPGAE